MKGKARTFCSFIARCVGLLVVPLVLVSSRADGWLQYGGMEEFPAPDNVLPGYQYRLVPAIIEGTNHIYLHRENSVPRWGPYLPTERVRIGGKEAGDWVRFYLSLRLGEFEISQTDIVDVQLGTESEPAECRFERFDYPLSPPRAYKKYLDPKLAASFETDEGWADLEMTALAGQRDGKIVVAGNFTRVNGERRRQLVRITFEGRIDETFRNALASEAMVRFMRVQADGKIVVAGENLAGDGVRLVRLEPNGLLDASFQAAVTGGISGLALMTSGDIVVAHETNLVRFAENGDFSPEPVPEGFAMPNDNVAGGSGLFHNEDGKGMVHYSAIWPEFAHVSYGDGSIQRIMSHEHTNEVGSFDRRFDIVVAGAFSMLSTTLDRMETRVGIGRYVLAGQLESHGVNQPVIVDGRVQLVPRNFGGPLEWSTDLRTWLPLESWYSDDFSGERKFYRRRF